MLYFFGQQIQRSTYSQRIVACASLLHAVILRRSVARGYLSVGDSWELNLSSSTLTGKMFGQVCCMTQVQSKTGPHAAFGMNQAFPSKLFLETTRAGRRIRRPAIDER